MITTEAWAVDLDIEVVIVGLGALAIRVGIRLRVSRCRRLGGLRSIGFGNQFPERSLDGLCSDIDVVNLVFTVPVQIITTQLLVIHSIVRRMG